MITICTVVFHHANNGFNGYAKKIKCLKISVLKIAIKNFGGEVFGFGQWGVRFGTVVLSHKHQRQNRPPPHFAHHLNIPLVLPHNLPGEAQADARTRGLGGEKRHENLLQVLSLDWQAMLLSQSMLIALH
jgi:hypothetical protein